MMEQNALRKGCRDINPGQLSRIMSAQIHYGGCVGACVCVCVCTVCAITAIDYYQLLGRVEMAAGN